MLDSELRLIWLEESLLMLDRRATFSCRFVCSSIVLRDSGEKPVAIGASVSKIYLPRVRMLAFERILQVVANDEVMLRAHGLREAVFSIDIDNVTLLGHIESGW
jgi:hypothetical protein